MSNTRAESTPSLAHSVAERDTPETVKVPESLAGLAVWAVGRFGIGVVFLGMVYFQYRDQSALVDRMMKALENRAVVDAQVARAMTDINAILVTLTQEVRSAHDRAAGKLLKP